MDKSELIKLIELCQDDAEIIIQNEDGVCFNIKELEVYTDTIFIDISQINKSEVQKG